MNKTASKTNGEETTSIIGYVHHLSPIKTSQNKNQYFDLKLQTQQAVYRTVCFAPEKYTAMKQKYEASSPVKLTRYQLKRNERTNNDEVLLSKRTKIEDPGDNETSFDITPVESDWQKPAIDISAEETTKCQPNTLVNICGRITFTGLQEIINVRGKYLTKQEAVFTDESGSIRTVLWEKDIEKLKSGQCYKIKEIMVREFQQQNYLTLNKQTSLNEINTSISRTDDNFQAALTHELVSPPDGVNYIQRFLSCKKCHNKIVNPNTAKKTVQCSQCNLTQLQSKSKKQLLVSIFFSSKDNEDVSIQIHDDKIEELYTLFLLENQVDQPKLVIDLEDEELTEVILTVKATLVFNTQKVVTAVNPS